MKRRMNGENAVYKSGDRWHVQGWVDGKRQRVSRGTRTEALSAWEARWGNDARSVVIPETAHLAAAGERTVTETVQQWLEGAVIGLAASTSAGYRDALRLHITPTLGSLSINQLNVETVERWQSRLLQGSSSQRALSPSTVRQARIVLRQALDQQVRYGHLASNPVTLAKGLPKKRPETTFLTEQEAQQVIRAANTPALRARWLLGLSLGLRSGEVLALRWCDLELGDYQPSLRVSASLKYRPGQGLVLEDTKTRSSNRTIRLAPEHVTALKAVRAEQQRERLANVGEFNPQRFVFTTSRGTPIDPNNDAKQWHKLLAAAGVRRVRRHDARHTAATLMLKDGTSPAFVQKVLGHSSISTTVDRYGHLVAADGAEATARLAAALTA